MHGTEAIIAAWTRARRRGERGVLATVVQVRGSAYRRPGARAFFPADGEPVGLVSGGCLEADLAGRARQVLAVGEPCTVVYDMRSPDDIVWGLGLGCNGEIRVLLQPLIPGDAADAVGFLADCARRRCHGALATLFDAEDGAGGAVGDWIAVDDKGTPVGTGADSDLRRAMAGDCRRALSDRNSFVTDYDRPGGPARALVEHVRPPLRLVVLGAGDDARPVVRLAREVGWQVVVVDQREARATAQRFPEANEVRAFAFDRLADEGPVLDSRTPAVVMTHHFLNDLDILTWLLDSSTPYIGLLGPRQRTDNLLDELAKRGVRPDPASVARIHGPLGLDVGAETPEEIAASLVGEVLASMNGRPGGFLRDRRGALHDWPS